jgi:anaerobic sulfite reductase subunit C
MLRGDAIDLPEEFFEEDEDALYKIEICPAKFGACTPDKREMIRNILVPLRKKIRELDLTRVVLESARTPLMSHHVFRFSIIGCSNCCMSPYSSDFGIIALYKPEVLNEGCIKCKACLVPCVENAIDLENDNPVIDYDKCMMCGGCETACKKDIIRTKEKGYKVVVGGTGSRHPKIAITAAEFTDVEGVLSVVEKGIALFKEKTKDKEMSFHGVIEKYGVDSLKI